MQVLIFEPILLVLKLGRILLEIRNGPLVLSFLSLHRSLLDRERWSILETEHVAVHFMCIFPLLYTLSLLLTAFSCVDLEVRAEFEDIISYLLLHLVFGLLLLLAEA